jgi:tetratricopeptide (TPR) repeat protein
VQDRLRQTELARVEATARAAEERKRRKLTLGLAAAVLALLTVGGGGAAMHLQQRRDQASRLELALREVNLLRSQAEADPEGDPAKWRSAVEAVKRAEDLLGPLIDGESRRRVRELGAQVASAAKAAERDAALLRETVDIHSAEADDPDGSASEAAYSQAFRTAEIDIDAMGPQAAGAEIKARPKGVALALAAALDDWAAHRRMARPKDTDGWKRLVATAQAADPEPTRDRMRRLWSEPDLKAQRQPLLQLARETNSRSWPPASLTLLAGALNAAGERDAAADLLRRGQAEHPGDVWVNYSLARILEQLRPPRTEEAIQFYRVARALRPETAHELAHALESCGRDAEAMVVFRDLTELRSEDGRHWLCMGSLLKERGDRAGAEKALGNAIKALLERIGHEPGDQAAHYNLGLALHHQGKLDEAIAEYRVEIRLRPDEPSAHSMLGLALYDQGKVAEAIAECREAIRLKPDYAEGHVNLGNALDDQGKVADAIAEYREAIRLKPVLFHAHSNLGHVLRTQGNLSEAIFEHREAVRLKPDDAEAHSNLGLDPRAQGKLSEAIAEYCEAIRLKPDLAEAHCNLGHTLSKQGQFREALAELRRGHELGSKEPGWRYPSAEWVRQAERMVELEIRLPAVIRGADKPKDAAERLEFAYFAYNTKQFSLSARLFGESLGTDPKLAEDMKAGNRYNAACAAALAAAGKGNEKPPLDEPEKTRWRKQALEWLKADLAHWSKQAETGRPEAKARVRQKLQHWKADADLAGIRDEIALKARSVDEQKACQALWAEVDQLLQRVKP